MKARGLRVTMQKLDPYINVDPGTMNPFQHGEVFVTDDGCETDLDLGHYERFIDESLYRLQRHHRRHLLDGDRGRAPRRVPGRHRPGHPAHHQRDQGPHRARGRGRRRGHHRGRRHRRRHRVAAVPGGDPPAAPRHRPRARGLRPRLPGPLHRALGRAEDQADPALGPGAALARHPARRDRVPHRPADHRRPQAQDLAAVRRRRRGGRVRPDADSIYEIPLVLHAEGLDDYLVRHLRLEEKAASPT